MRRSGGSGRVRHTLKDAAIGVVTLALTCGILLGASTPATAASYVDDTAFGLHVPRIADGAEPTVSFGTVRLWDSGVAWGQVERRNGSYWWLGLDKAVAAANTQGAEILYVLGSTPTWAASHRSQGTYPNRGAASNPRSMADWRSWVTAVVRRHGNSIDAYQIWNEANLQTFWQGTPTQMARLTLEAQRIIRRLDPTATVVAASSTVRLTSAFNRFFPAYLVQLRKRGWPVDVFAIHTYGPSTSSPALRATYISRARKALRAARAPARPLWDTEVNYGIKGPGSSYPDKDLAGTKAAIYVGQTYLDSIRMRIARTYWYAWSPPVDLLGITMFNGTTGARAYQAVFDWMGNAWVTCRTGAVNSCIIDRAGVRSEVAWMSTGTARNYVVPTNATQLCDVLGRCRAVIPGSLVKVGRMPVRLGPGA